MSRWIEQELYGWGRYPKVRAECATPTQRAEITQALADRDGRPILAHAMGRSYGDAALLEGGRVILTERLDRMLDFDPASGWLRVEAGVSLLDIIRTFVPRGFFPPVVPGTQFITVGGAIGCDIHGKNHHLHGCFSDHVRNLQLLTASGEIVTCDAEQQPELFWATAGGMGLTGIILSLEVQLTRVDNPYIEMETIRVENLDEFFAVAAASRDYTHTVSWIDCVARGNHLGRGIFMRGRHASAGVSPGGALSRKLMGALEPLFNVPFDGPSWLLGKASVALFNEAYFRKCPRGETASVVHYEPFFFPLDFVRNWNRLYGRRGFLQYQLVVPHDPEHRAIREVLTEISASGMASFLAVIKEFGDRPHGGLSFPMGGITLALDFGFTGQPLLDLLDRLDAVVAGAGGRVYLGKDARVGRATFQRMYPEWTTWKAIRDRWDPEGVFQSDLGHRLGL